MYVSLEATLHDHFWSAEDSPSELPLIESFLKNVDGPSLEIGCGSGRLLIPLIKKNYQVEGLELSLDMLNLLRKKADENGVNPTTHIGDATMDLPMDTDYAAYLIPAFTIQLFSRQQAIDLLDHLRNRASNHPKLYLTTFIPWPEITGELEENTWNHDKETTLADNAVARCDTNHTIDRLNQTLFRNHRYTVTTANGFDTKSHQSAQTLRYYGLPELSAILHKTGWHIEKVITDFDPAHLDTDAHIITIEATAC